MIEAPGETRRTTSAAPALTSRATSPSHPDRPPPANPKPAHYFRRAVQGKLRAYSFYKQLVRWTPGGGAYWLEI